MLGALGSVVIGFAVSIAAAIALFMAAILLTGNMPSKDPGHPLIAVIEIIFYAAGGWFAWWRLRAAGRRPFRAFTRGDVRAIVIGLAALVVARIGTGVELVLTHQTKHVQSGFEHFDVVTKVPSLTVLAVALTVVATTVAAPVVEEIVFRGLLFGALAPGIGVAAAALITALLFGAVHGDLVLFPTLAALGLVNAFAYAATGNLWVPIALHALNNALGAGVLISTSLHRH